MASDIQFPDIEPRYDFERDCLGFPALVDGEPVECLVTLELLMHRFGANAPTEEAMRDAYREHRETIRDIARQHIQFGWIDEDRRVFLTTQYTRLSVYFDGPLSSDPHVVMAHRMLTDIIGPNAGEIVIEWRTSSEYPPNSTIYLHLKDPAIRREVSTAFPPKAWNNRDMLGVALSRLLSALLTARSRDLLLKLG